jgi:hypothetical protein
MKFANSVINSRIGICSIYDAEKLKLFTARVKGADIEKLVTTLSDHGWYIIADESDINRLENGDMLFSIGDKLTIGEIRCVGNAPITYVQSKYTYVWVGDKFVVIDEYR